LSSVHRRLPHILLASAFALAAFGTTPALSKSKPNFGDVKGESTQKDHKEMSAMSTRCDTHRAQQANGVSSDPEEGGQITASKAHVGEIKVTKPVDTASNKLMEKSAPGSPCSH